MKNLMIKTPAALLIVLQVSSPLLPALTATVARADQFVASPLPDSLNMPKYRQIYLRDKASSEQLRANAAQWAAQAQDLDRRANEVANAIVAQGHEATQHTQSIERYQDEIRSLNTQNFSLDAEIRRLSQLIQINNDSLSRLERDANHLRERIRKLETEQNEIGQKLLVTRAKLAREQKDLDVLVADIQVKKTSAQQLTQSAQNKEKQSDQLKQKADSQSTELAKKETDLNALKSGLSGIEANAATLQQTAASEKAKLAPLRAEIQTAKAAEGAADVKVNASQSELAKLEQKVRQAEKVVQGLQTALKADEDKLAKKKAKLTEVEAEPDSPQKLKKIADLKDAISSLESEIAGDKSKLATAESDANTAAQAVKTETAELNQLKKELQQAKAVTQTKKAALEAAEPAYIAAQAAADAATLGVQKARTAINGLEREVASLKQSLPGLIAKAAELRQEARTEKAQALKLQAEVDLLDNKLPGQIKEVQNAKLENEKIEREYSQMDGRIDEVKKRLFPLVSEIRVLSEENHRYDQTVQNDVRQFNENVAGVDQRRVWISQLSGQINQLQQLIAQNQTQLASLQNQAQDTWNSYATADAAATAAEAQTRASYSRYATVKSAYDVEMTKAEKSGRTQGLAQGQADGTSQGSVDGTAVGKQEGEIDGKSEGLAHGLARGKADGAAKGKSEGYQHGKSLPENYQQGHAAGLTQGATDAASSAQANEYPAAREAVRKAKTAKPPANQITVDNQSRTASAGRVSVSLIALGSRNAGKAEKALNQIKNHGGEVRADLLNGGMLLGSMNSVELQNVAEITGAIETSSTNFDTLFARVEINLAAAHCDQQYDVFIQGCLSAYQSAYATQYDSSYKSSHKEAKNTAYQNTYKVFFEANKDVKYTEGYTLAYNEAYSQWDAIGATEAKATGYAEGKKSGFDANIDAARKAATESGTQDEIARFQNGPVISMLDAIIAKSKTGTYVAGDTIQLQLKLANYGAKATQRGEIKVSWESQSSDISTEDAVSQIVVIPAETTAAVTSVAFARIGINAGSGETHKIRVRAILPDGTKQEKTLTLVTKLFITPQIARDFNANPNVDGFIGIGYASHKVKVTLKNPTSNNAEKEFSAKLIPSSASDVTMKVSALSAGKLGAGQSKTLELEYKFKNTKVKGKPFKFTLQTFYGTDKTSEEVLTVMPK